MCVPGTGIRQPDHASSLLPGGPHSYPDSLGEPHPGPVDIYPAEEISVQEDIEVVEEGQTIAEARLCSLDPSSVLPLPRCLQQQPCTDAAFVQRQRYRTAASVHTL